MYFSCRRAGTTDAFSVRQAIVGRPVFQDCLKCLRGNEGTLAGAHLRRRIGVARETPALCGYSIRLPIFLHDPGGRSVR